MAELKLNEVKSALEEMRPRFDAGFTGADKAYLDRVYYRLFGKEYPHKGTGCKDCYRDQYLIICSTMKKIKNLPKVDYALKNGVVLVIPFTNKYYSGIVPAEVAEAYLAKFPAKANLFSKLPDDWAKRCEKRVKAKDAPKDGGETDNSEEANGEGEKPTNETETNGETDNNGETEGGENEPNENETETNGETEGEGEK